MHFQVRLYTPQGVVSPDEIPELVDYRKRIDGGEVYHAFTTPYHARKALHEYCTAVPVIAIGGEVIRIDNVGHYRTVYRFANR